MTIESSFNCEFPVKITSDAISQYVGIFVFERNRYWIGRITAKDPPEEMKKIFLNPSFVTSSATLSISALVS